MPKPIRLLIKKKTLVQLQGRPVHTQRSDWCNAGAIDYSISPQIFKSISPQGFVVNDAQFAKYLKETYGEGEYYVMMWRMKTKGFLKFMQLQCGPNSYIRMKRKESREDKELRESKADLQKINARLRDAESTEEREEIKEEARDVLDDVELIKDIRTLYYKKDACPLYLKSVLPVFKEHEYEDYDYGDNTQQLTQQRWI